MTEKSAPGRLGVGAGSMTEKRGPLVVLGVGAGSMGEAAAKIAKQVKGKMEESFMVAMCGRTFDFDDSCWLENVYGDQSDRLEAELYRRMG